MKKLISLTVVVILLLSAIPAYASSIDSVTVNYLENGYYTVTVIEDVSDNATVARATNTATKTKTTYVKNSAGATLWYVRVTGTFTYGDGTAKCTSATPSATSQHASWQVSNITGSKSGATAYASATGKQYLDGTVINTITENVSLTCSPTGQFS